MNTELGIIIFLAVMTAGAWGLKQSGQRDIQNEKNYLERHAKIAKIILSHEVCEQNFKYILHLLDGLRSMKWKDHRRTGQLTDLFNGKYQEFIEKRDAEMFK